MSCTRDWCRRAASLLPASSTNTSVTSPMRRWPRPSRVLSIRSSARATRKWADGAPLCRRRLARTASSWSISSRTLPSSSVSSRPLHTEPERARPLAGLVFEKTAGNPFFTIQFLSALVEEALLAFDPGIAAWSWNLPRIRAKGFTDYVADLMAAKLNRLPPATQNALGRLACLGNVAETATLSVVHGASEEAIHAALLEAVRAGLVIRSDSAFMFLHDRIQEAAYALIAEGERAMAHLRIGRLLAARTTSEEVEERIFDIVDQFDRGAVLITADEERKQVAALNLMAG